tara:strand:- start:1197 stop:1463 length:267 start_codon:yes stop_codon:yes gene_type:complete
MEEHGWTILVGNPVWDNIDLFLGPLGPEADKFIDLPEGSTWAEVAVATGIMPSTTQARKNGWGEDLKPGLNHRMHKKTRKEIWVLVNF